MLAVLPGRVRGLYPSGELRNYGNVVVLEHPEAPLGARFTMYAHLESFGPIAVGQPVEAGQVIGAVGRTAGTREDPSRMFTESRRHLHFEALTRWPPSGRDLDRVDATEWLRPLGILAEPRSRLRVADGSPAWCAADRLERAQEGAQRPSTGEIATGAAAGGFGGLALLAILYAFAQGMR